MEQRLESPLEIHYNSVDFLLLVNSAISTMIFSIRLSSIDLFDYKWTVWSWVEHIVRQNGKYPVQNGLIGRLDSVHQESLKGNIDGRKFSHKHSINYRVGLLLAFVCNTKWCAYSTECEIRIFFGVFVVRMKISIHAATFVLCTHWVCSSNAVSIRVEARV